MGEVEKLEGEICPICLKKTLTLMDQETEVPYFGKVFVFSMNCSDCKYNKADVETADKHDPCKYTFEVTEEEDMKIRIVKSSEATVKIPHIMTISPGPASSGYVTNIEGVLERVKSAIETTRDSEEDPAAKKKAKNLLKKLQKVIWGQEKIKIILEDPSGNSAIISEKAKKEKLK